MKPKPHLFYFANPRGSHRYNITSLVRVGFEVTCYELSDAEAIAQTFRDKSIIVDLMIVDVGMPICDLHPEELVDEKHPSIEIWESVCGILDYTPPTIFITHNLDRVAVAYGICETRSQIFMPTNNLSCIQIANQVSDWYEVLCANPA